MTACSSGAQPIHRRCAFDRPRISCSVRCSAAASTFVELLERPSGACSLQLIVPGRWHCLMMFGCFSVRCLLTQLCDSRMKLLQWCQMGSSRPLASVSTHERHQLASGPSDVAVCARMLDCATYESLHAVFDLSACW